MEYKYLGNTGLLLSSVSFGTQTMGWNVFGNEAHTLLDAYCDKGGNYLDTADSYNEGQSEIILGEWLKKTPHKKDIVIGTKTFFSTGADINRTGHSRKHICQSLEESLKRLNVDAIDLYQLHCYDAATSLEEIMATMDTLVKQGKIRYYGLSNFTPSNIMKGVMLQKQFGRFPIASLQLEYSLLVRSPEWELLPLCSSEGIGALCWSPLAGGWLTGKYKKDQDAPENSRVGRKDRWDDQEDQRGGEKTWDILEVLQDIAQDRGYPVSQVAINWLRKKDAVTSVLMGARTMEQLSGNLGAADWSLSDEEEGRLDKVSAVGAPSPYSFISRYTRKTGSISDGNEL